MKCEHKNTKPGEVIGLCDYEICLGCGLRRSISEQESSNWMLNGYALQQEFKDLQAQLHALRWRKVEDGLPEEGQRILIIDADGNPMTLWLNGGTYKGLITLDQWKYKGLSYWMPIPPLPKEADNANTIWQ